MQTLFTDFIGNISIASGVVRMDMYKITGTDPETKKVQYEVSGQLAMPMEGFLRSLQVSEKVRDDLVAQGILKPNTPPQA